MGNQLRAIPRLRKLAGERPSSLGDYLQGRDPYVGLANTLKANFTFGCAADSLLGTLVYEAGLDDEDHMRELLRTKFIERANRPAGFPLSCFRTRRENAEVERILPLAKKARLAFLNELAEQEQRFAITVEAESERWIGRPIGADVLKI